MRELLAPPRWSVKDRAPAALSSGFVRRLTTVAETLFDGEDEARIAWTIADFCDFASRGTTRTRAIFALSLWALTWIAPLLIGRMGPLASLEMDRRIRALERIEKSALGFAALGPKAILCMIWFEHPSETRTCLR